MKNQRREGKFPNEETILKGKCAAFSNIMLTLVGDVSESITGSLCLREDLVSIRVFLGGFRLIGPNVSDFRCLYDGVCKIYMYIKFLITLDE